MKKGVKNTSVHWLTHVRLRAHMQTLFSNMIHKNIRLTSLPTIPKGKRSFKKSCRMAESNLHSVTLKAFWSAFCYVIKSKRFVAGYMILQRWLTDIAGWLVLVSMSSKERCSRHPPTVTSEMTYEGDDITVFQPSLRALYSPVSRCVSFWAIPTATDRKGAKCPRVMPIQHFIHQLLANHTSLSTNFSLPSASLAAS